MITTKTPTRTRAKIYIEPSGFLHSSPKCDEAGVIYRITTKRKKSYACGLCGQVTKRLP